MGGEEVGSEEVETICIDFSFYNAGCEWNTYGGGNLKCVEGMRGEK